MKKLLINLSSCLLIFLSVFKVSCFASSEPRKTLLGSEKERETQANAQNFKLRPTGDIWLLEIDGVINPVVSDYISEGLKSAEKENVHAVIIKMDTPGGLMESMHQIVKDILNYPAPVIIWVGPSGARAASAGVFITMAGDVATMASQTNIGAAHPVQLGAGGEQKVSKEMTEKIIQDAKAYMKSIAKEKGRNWQWAQEAVSKSLSISSEDALKKNVIEYIADDLEKLKEILEGKEIVKKGKKIILSFKDKIIVKKTMSPIKKFLNVIAHPNLAYVLLILGIYGIIYEVSSPGIGFGAVIGGICLILAFFALQVLPINIAGLLLIVLGILLMLLDIKIPSGGILTAGGIIAFVLGSFMLFKSPEPYLKASVSVILSFTLFSALFFIFAVSKGVAVQRKKVTTGIEGLVGAKGETRTKLNPKGEIFVHGEIWKASSEEGKIEKGGEVVVTGVEGNRLKVKKSGT